MAGPVTLAPLRDDIRLLPGPTAADGTPSWTLYDPAAHRFIRLGWAEFEILARWELGDAERVAVAVGAETPLRVSADDVARLLDFAARAELLRPLDAASSVSLDRRLARGRLEPHRWLLKNYLFLRITLFDPDRLLSHLLPWVAWAFQPWFPVVLVGLAALGLALVGRRWDMFTHEMSYVFSAEGALMVAVAVSFAKVAHECGHGLAARHFGCRVPAMGIALLVLWPVLWTDVTDSWKLTDRRHRLVIDAAGMAAEIVLAVAASLLWGLLPDGALRSAVFLLAGSTWIITLAVNLNPLMRFDGYFLLSDWLDVPNLQDRSFALGRWWLRERLFGAGEPPPEAWPDRRRRLLVAYALAVWVYRFFLFLGIALLVYHLTFKALGVFLMAVEIWWFIARPILAEIGHWIAARRRLRWNPATMRAAALAVLLLLAALIPWRDGVTAPAVLRAGREVTLKTAAAGQLARLPAEGARLDEGETAFVLDSPDIEHRRTVQLAVATGQRERLAGLAFDRGDAGDMEVNWQEFQRTVAELAAIDGEADGLVVRAPFPGNVVDVMPALRPGLWLAKHEPLALLIDPGSMVAEAYVQEAVLERLRPGAKARFIPEDDGPSLELVLESIDGVSTKELAAAELASPHGGAIAVRPDASHHLIPEQSLYRLRLKPVAGGGVIGHRRRGWVAIEGETIAPLTEVWRFAAAALIRESGF